MQKLGFRVLFRNWRTKLGELDLIVLDRGCLVFVEVRSTEDEDLQGPLSSVDRAKQQQLTQLALEFLQAKRLLGRKCRFDVLAISWPTGRSEPSMEYVPNAFEATGAFQMHS
jgi:putative endonuclease